MTIVHVGGARGCGKTTVLKEVAQLVGKDEMHIVYASEVLASVAMKTFGEPWLGLGDIERKKVRDATISYITKLQTGIVLVDSHYVELDNDHVKAIVPDDFNKGIGCHIIIEAPPKYVQARRQADNFKFRTTDISSIKKEITAEREEAQRLAGLTGASLYMVENVYVSHAASNVISLLRTGVRIWK
ncbi:MAG: AAA family ATPase [Candidatus Marsarchaeota archaeon]|jgi:adenylate kinase|nr:AAA family ATPase [Candidatus Marsarchaeota archaeon]MCL5111503.1 AAA family ATPase [Candidatus Marsarchaeota archaeon]